MATPQELSDQEVLTGPMLLLLRRMERNELIVERMAKKGLISEDEIELANLKSTLNHAERLIRVREKTRRSADDVRLAAETVRQSIAEIEERLGRAV